MATAFAAWKASWFSSPSTKVSNVNCESAGAMSCTSGFLRRLARASCSASGSLSASAVGLSKRSRSSREMVVWFVTEAWAAGAGFACGMCAGMETVAAGMGCAGRGCAMAAGALTLDAVALPLLRSTASCMG